MMKSIAVAIAFFAMPSLPSVAQPGYDYGPGGNPYPRTYPGPPRRTPYWSGYVDAPVGEPAPPCHWMAQRFWDGQGWRERRVRICGADQTWPSGPSY